jgi:hypothetical protein
VVLVGGIVAEVVQSNLHNALVYSAFDDGLGERTFKHFGENGDDVDAHILFLEFSAKVGILYETVFGVGKNRYFCPIFIT